MADPTDLNFPTSAPRNVTIADAAHFGLIELRNASGLVVQLLPTGAIFALRHGSTLLNQVLPGPVEEGLFRLILRWRPNSGTALAWAHLEGSRTHFRPTGSNAATWTTTPVPGLHAETRLQLHPTLPAWRWSVALRNESEESLSVDVLHAQDLALADEGAVRNNEAYTSQYIDLLPVEDEALGWTVLARQNQAMAQGRHPWLALGCVEGATAFCTDGTQFFGVDHRLTGVPAAVSSPGLPSQRLQYEFALGGLQTRSIQLERGANAQARFIARYLEDHPAASSSGDLALLRELTVGEWPNAVGNAPAPLTPAASNAPPHQSEGGDTSSAIQTASSLFVRAPWIHGDSPSLGDWDAWFHGERRHEEYGPDETIHSFFHGAHTHVVARDKEAVIARPHGHILRSGDSRWFDAEQFGLTCYAAGIFAAQAYLGHPNFARLLSVVRNALNVTRASGQRVFVRRNAGWQQLGIPSAFAMSPGEVRWIYRFGEDVIEARVWCARDLAASFLELRVTAGPPCEFLISHELVLGAVEFEHGGTLDFHREGGWIGCRPAAESLVGQHQPDVCFAIASAERTTTATWAGDGLLYEDGVERQGPYVSVKTGPVEEFGVILLGSSAGTASLSDKIEAARAAFKKRIPPAQPPGSPVRLSGGHDAGVARINEVLPWFTHNASIHFSAPHGLEQYGGAAWGVRDVCQGSVEWLLAAGEFSIVRRILEAVFAQQYPADGSWPQWFMFPPYRFIQQAHSHGDVCFWPVKALCDYIEASNDTEILYAPIGYTDPAHFETCGPVETVLAHCDRVIAQGQARFFPGTALVNYGDGDWDDTLQPADPALRTRMISAWTVGLAFHTFRQFAEVCLRIGDPSRAKALTALCERMKHDFSTQLLPDGVVAGFVLSEADGSMRPLLHPRDSVTGIRYRLLPMTRSIIAELFTPDEARRHLEIIARELRYPDGVRLMSEPSAYHGGVERLFKRAETAANVGREIGLQYVHAHLRYAEALAKIGDADGLWAALQVVNPVALTAMVPNAASRQSNVYFSSSDADFADRNEAAAHWADLRTGKIAVRGGWRLYSSGPGLFLHKIRACLLGVRESFGDILFDPVLPRSLDGLVAQTTLCGQPVELHYRVSDGCFGPRAVSVNSAPCPTQGRAPNPYRTGGLLIARANLSALLNHTANTIEIDL